jgi:DNA-binding CsgD family transcriptional regulator
MKQLRQLDNSTLTVLGIALDGFQQYETSHPQVVRLFLAIIELLIGSIQDLDIWGIRKLISQEKERRMRRITVKVISTSVFAGVSRLGERERLVLKLIGEGQRSEAIIDLLNISYRTLANHKANIVAKLGLGSARDLTRFAIDNLTVL